MYSADLSICAIHFCFIYTFIMIKLQQGDSFTMNFVLKENNTPVNVGFNEDLAVGFYDENGNKYVIKLSQNQIHTTEKEGYYTASVPSEITKNFIGYVDIEIVIYDQSGNDVSHADKVLKMYFEERRINSEI